MSTGSWILDALGADRIQQARDAVALGRLSGAVGQDPPAMDLSDLHLVADGLALRVMELLDTEDPEQLCGAAAAAFSVMRGLPRATNPLIAAEELVRLGCVAVLGERGADIRRLLAGDAFPDLPADSTDWGERVWATLLDVWLRLFRKRGWADLDAVQAGILRLRSEQQAYEPNYLAAAQERRDVAPAWDLMSKYHLAKAAEILATYLGQGSVDRHFDVLQQLEAHFDRALAVAEQGGLAQRESLTRLLARTAVAMVASSIWTVTRAVNSRVTRFVGTLVDRRRAEPVFEMLPPQRRALRDEGLLGSSNRAVVVSLPTSSGKTLIAQFRILQALNQFDQERGWVAYLAPTRALVNQITRRLRRDFAPLGVAVEKVSPALEVDGLEAGMLESRAPDEQFRVLVTTPEKLDLLLRGGWEERIDRPLTLVVVDEAHNLGNGERGLKLELLLATINRDCRHAQFLLLTPFIPNASAIARWLAPESHQDIELSIDWCPNDRLIALAIPVKGTKKGDFSIQLRALHTNRATLEVPTSLPLKAERRPLGLSYSKVGVSPPARGRAPQKTHASPNKLAAATAQLLHQRGTVIVLVESQPNAWTTARLFKREENRVSDPDALLPHIQRFLVDEMGADSPLASLLEYGVGVHHGGLSDDARALVEHLAERSFLRVLVATTTIAQGVNFPVSGVVIASHQLLSPRPPFRTEMPVEDFWNIAGRAGRVDQGDLGIVAFAAESAEKERVFTEYAQRSVAELNSTLLEMAQTVGESSLADLSKLSPRPAWSAFLQYLVHSYRQIGDHERFVAEVEQVLRGTLGFQTLRKTHRGWADQLVRGVATYAQDRMSSRPGELALVDATGFSLESVGHTLRRSRDEGVRAESWSPSLFSGHDRSLEQMLGILLCVPELQANLRDAAPGDAPDGTILARILCDWVQGRPLPEIAEHYFLPGIANEESRAQAMGKCCRSIFSKLTQTASWGLAALQSLTLGDRLEELPEVEQRTLRNLPARAFYGVNTDEAIALRLLGVPRSAAIPLASTITVDPSASLHQLRVQLRQAGLAPWKAALGGRGESFYQVWKILEGER